MTDAGGVATRPPLTPADRARGVMYALRKSSHNITALRAAMEHARLERDLLLLQADAEGVPRAELEHASGLSQAQVSRVITRWLAAGWTPDWTPRPDA